MITFRLWPTFGYIKLFNRLISYRHQTKEWGLSFSERNGYTKYFKFGNYIINVERYSRRNKTM